MWYTCDMALDRRFPVAFVCLALWALAGCSREPAPRDGAAYVKARYEKYEHRIPMRDGVALHTVVYRPRDRSKAYPILLTRTPYRAGPYGEGQYRDTVGPSPGAMQAGYIFVYQDVRGRFLSEGEFVDMRPQVPHERREPGDVDESTDAHDTIEWLVQNLDGHNGKVGMWGISYPGFYSAAGMIDSHPALVAVSPQAPIADWFWDDMHRHGAFVLALAFRFFSTFGKPRDGLIEDWPKRFDFKSPDAYQFYLDMGPLARANELHLGGEIAFWNELAAHPNYDGFWKARNLLPHLHNIKSAVLTVGGWFDTEDLYGPLHVYEAVEAGNPGIFNTLVMGPWSHGGWARTEGEWLGRAHFGSKTSLAYQEKVELPFFEHHLKGAPAPALPEALVFETGANRWRAFAEWPPAELRKQRLYLREQGGLDFEPPALQPPTPRTTPATRVTPAHLAEAHDVFVSDPAKPVPYTMEVTTALAKEYMTEDQRFASWRPDVLVYRSAPLEEDLTVGGPLRAELWVATSATDADWIVKVIDVHPDDIRRDDGGVSEMGGHQMLVRAEAFRGRFRQSYEQPAPFASNEITKVSFELWDVLHTFRKGHRIMVHVQSTWFPFIDRNPQTYVLNIFEAGESDFVAATHRVYRSAAYPSSIELGVVDAPYERTQAPFMSAAPAP
jgi:putative CocE/NonD family hydrolase